MKQHLVKQAILIFLLCIGTSLSAQETSTERQAHFNLNKSVAIDGYDPVAYFTQNEGRKGSKAIQSEWKGVTYYFLSVENQELFDKNPSQYEPQYGGWCAYAMGLNGQKVEVNPKTFKIVEGKLLLFYNAFFNNTLDSWNEDEINLKPQADQNWSNLINQK